MNDHFEVTSTGIVDGIIQDKYGKRGALADPGGFATCSLPLKMKNAPEGTRSFALILEDKDAIPVCGFSWIHWTAANIVKNELEEDESRTATDFVQGTNSYSGLLAKLSREETSRYAGMYPPDAPHMYELHVYALDTLLDLEQGFYMNELYWKMQGHILAECTLKGTYFN